MFLSMFKANDEENVQKLSKTMDINLMTFSHLVIISIQIVMNFII